MIIIIIKLTLFKINLFLNFSILSAFVSIAINKLQSDPNKKSFSRFWNMKICAKLQEPSTWKTNGKLNGAHNLLWWSKEEEVEVKNLAERAKRRDLSFPFSYRLEYFTRLLKPPQMCNIIVINKQFRGIFSDLNHWHCRRCYSFTEFCWWSHFI